MKDQELLFLAVGGANPELVARSERRRRNRRLPYSFVAAACLTLLLALGYVLPLWMDEPDSYEPPISTISDLPENQSPDDGQFALPEQGSEIGTLRLLSYAPESQGKTVDFLIYVNEEQFHMQEENGIFRLRSTYPLPDNFPECGMDIFHLSDTSPSQAKLEAEDALKDHYPEMSSEELAAALPGSLYLRASESLEQDSEEIWNAEQAELWFVDDGQGGTFVLTARYFLEAEEGMGRRFRDMVSSFRVVDRNESVPDWMRNLYAAVDRLSQALFTNDLSDISDLLAEGADTYTYDKNVWPDISIVSVDYALDDDRNPAKAMVSIKHRLNETEGDSFSYLTMELVFRDGSWQMNWSGIEK